MIDRLKETAHELGCLELALKVLDDPMFVICSGSHYEKAHHYGDGGLLRHTFEVATISLDVARFYAHSHSIDYKELFLSAIYHDYGKIWDYDKNENGLWVANNHRRKIHHISRSNVEWVRQAVYLNADEKLIDGVSHNILSHHGSRSCGSPVLPLTREAWILHYADSLSARIDDCDRIDIEQLHK